VKRRRMHRMWISPRRNPLKRRVAERGEFPSLGLVVKFGMELQK
jgi:hypothetical protein